ncbi:MAG: hypothetical protein KIS96_04995 [Bauldia sp.]|nr:hypothetical protein [Bauldia sp.]
MRQGESAFSYYDASARPAMEVYRNLLNYWLSALPPAEEAELVSRLRSTNFGSYAAALSELMVRTALTRAGRAIETHPISPNGRRPDFWVFDAERPSHGAFVEVTSFNPSGEHIARNNREARLYNAIDSLDLGGMLVGYDVVQYGESDPRLRDVAGAITGWAADFDESDPSDPPRKIFAFGDWQIEVMLFGRRKEVDPDAQRRTIGAAMGETRWVSGAEEIKGALEVKTRRYGNLGAPYVIAVVDNKGELTGGEANEVELVEALFGDEAYQFPGDDSGELRLVRQRNGFFGHGGQARNTNVTAVVLLPRADLWSLRDPKWQPILAVNPWAEFPLPRRDFIPIPFYEMNPERGVYERHPGHSLADLLELPMEWPPRDD